MLGGDSGEVALACDAAEVLAAWQVNRADLLKNIDGIDASTNQLLDLHVFLPFSDS